jgi:hypothetical protein
MPPVSVTMQPRNLAADAEAVELELAPALVVPVDPEAELWLLPQAAIISVADAASAAVAHALCLTFPSKGRAAAAPSLDSSGLTRRLCLVTPPGKRTRAHLTCSLPNRNPTMMVFLARQTYHRGFRRWSWCFPTG